MCANLQPEFPPPHRCRISNYTANFNLDGEFYASSIHDFEVVHAARSSFGVLHYSRKRRRSYTRFSIGERFRASVRLSLKLFGRGITQTKPIYYSERRNEDLEDAEKKLSEETSGNDKASGKTDASVTTETFGLSIEETVNTGFGVRFNGIFYSRGRRKFLSSYLRETEGVIEEDRSIYHPPKKKVILNPNYGKRTFYVQPAVS
ncbi:640_t:CDS:2 [Paraglomus brasilianum]|uniref:640_t:CDS:1 n=1 Tax=Paraglomus brasilianum TaxID=144538 RepID=A0A9N8YX42_9GLOM|nr:640_t:CDS:2 [Paraglomus brasilianum]